MGMVGTAAIGKAAQKGKKQKYKGVNKPPKMGSKGGVKPTAKAKTNKAANVMKASKLPFFGLPPSAGGKPKGSKVTTAGDIQQTVTDYAKAQKKKTTKAPAVAAQNMLGFAAQQPPGPAMDPQQLAAAKSAQETQFQAAGAAMQDKFKQQNPNAPKMPAGIGIQGAPANQPQQFQQADDMPTGWAERMKSRGIVGPQQPKLNQAPQPRYNQGNRGKGGQNPTGGKGAMRPSPRPNVQMTDSGAIPQSSPRPRPNMSRGGKGGQRPSFGGFGGGKGGRRPSPSMGRPNPYAPGGALEPRKFGGGMTPGTGMQAPNVSAQAIDPVQASSAMMKKAPAFKMRSKTSTTFKEMGSSSVNKKSAPTRKTSTGYKMPGFGKR